MALLKGLSHITKSSKIAQMGGKYIKFEILVVRRALDHMPESSLPVYIFLDVIPRLLFDIVLGLIESKKNFPHSSY